MIPRWRAEVTASVRWLTSSFFNMLATWVLTVLSLMDRSAEICLLADPLALSCRTSASRSERVSLRRLGSELWRESWACRVSAFAATQGSIWDSPRWTARTALNNSSREVSLSR